MTTDEQQELTGGAWSEDFFNVGLDQDVSARDYDVDADRTREVDREVDIEEEDVFNALAISQNSGQTIDFNDLADVETTQSVEQNVDALSDFEEETVFAALALGVTEDGGELQSLAAAGGDVQRSAEAERTVVQDVDLDRDNTLLAIALSNGGGSELDWRDVADVQRSVEDDVTADQEVDLSEEDAFLALALGIGGNGATGAGGGGGGDAPLTNGGGGDTGGGDTTEGLLGGNGNTS